MMLLFKKRDPHRFESKKFKKLLKKAVRYLEKSDFCDLENLEEMEGNGVYMIHFNGFNLYDFLTTTVNNPIYIGKAVPKGWRSGRIENSPSYNLYKRLSEHAKSISCVNNLYLPFFKYKYIILDGDLIPAVEAEAIRKFSPLWNCFIEGFGNHNVGRNRLGQTKSEWDTLHPGRSWADRMQEVPVNEIKDKVVKRIFGG